MVFLTLPVGDRTVVIKLDGVQLFGEDFLIDHLFTRRCPSRKGLAQLAVYYSTSMTCVSCWIQPTRHAILCRKKSGTLDILLLLLLLGGGGEDYEYYYFADRKREIRNGNNKFVRSCMMYAKKKSKYQHTHKVSVIFSL